MRRSVIIQFVCLAMLAGGCAVEVDDPVPAPEDADAVVSPPDACPTAWSIEERAPERNLAELIEEARAIAAVKDTKAWALPEALLHPIVRGPAACIKCLNVPNMPRLPQSGDVR